MIWIFKKRRDAVGAARDGQQRANRRDREFLPAALEILETPPSPASVALTTSICGFVALALIWSFVGRLDVHAVALGKIERAGGAKVIEPLEAGRIAAIHATQGQFVRAGDLLFELESAEAAADVSIQSNALYANLAEATRRRAEIVTARTARGIDDPAPTVARLSEAAADVDVLLHFEPAIPTPFRRREGAMMAADLSQLADTIDDLAKQVAQKEATRQRLGMSIAYQETLLETLEARVNTRQQAIDLSVGTRINLYDAKEILLKSKAALASDRGQLIEVEAAFHELQAQKSKAFAQFIVDEQTKLNEAVRKAEEANDSLAKARARLVRARLVAPIDGIVQQMIVTTIGQVVTPGQELAVVSQRDGPLQVEALVSNTDIGLIEIGEDVEIKVDAYSFTRYGTAHGHIERISVEAIDEQIARRNMSDATAGSSPLLSGSGSGPGQPIAFVFPVMIALDSSNIEVEGRRATLTPGMTVIAEIKTGKRRVIDYLWSPLAKTGSEALRER